MANLLCILTNGLLHDAYYLSSAPPTVQLVDEDKELLQTTNQRVQELTSLLQNVNKDKDKSLSPKRLKLLHKYASAGKKK